MLNKEIQFNTCHFLLLFPLLTNIWSKPTTDEVVKYFLSHDINTKEQYFVVLNLNVTIIM